MKPGMITNSYFLRAVNLCSLVTFLGLCAFPVFAMNKGRVVLRDSVPTIRRDELVSKLQKITGWSNLKFDQDGFLQLGTEDNGPGSKKARELLVAAIDGPNTIVIEDASSRADVAFCSVVPGRWLHTNTAQSPAFVVLIDFMDFRKIVGDDEARSAFDVGWGFLHELDHVVADSEDAEEQGLLGECENHINAMRSELGLPQRVEYFSSEHSLKTDPNFGNNLVRLAFERYDSQKARKRRYWIVWDSTAVGGLIVSNQTAAVRLRRSQRKK